MSDSAESTKHGFAFGFAAGVRDVLDSFVTDIVTAGLEHAPEPQYCEVCGDQVYAYEVCNECESRYYPPRQYWQLDDVQAEGEEVLSAS
ncbi:hypothetical protein [Halobacterium hubeiense]|uniref:hypothetical protein n=1 Tax=Halobacterium hubeiense TaxID=1407499 RepID=UPI003C72C7D7